ncbi:hypothetical protein [Mycobacteroides chelonae]|uniref:hypothetical protein n=1 Tax=Mycobacteroides chelonae TaxID=1774 RepID=UPI00104202F5
MTEQQGVRLDADDYASRTVTKQAGVSWAFAVDRRLDQLVDVANSVGANVRRSELVAALVSAASDDPQQLLQAIIAWRTSRVREVVIGVNAAAQVVELPRFGPGRRRGEGN